MLPRLTLFSLTRPCARLQPKQPTAQLAEEEKPMSLVRYPCFTMGGFHFDQDFELMQNLLLYHSTYRLYSDSLVFASIRFEKPHKPACPSNVLSWLDHLENTCSHPPYTTNVHLTVLESFPKFGPAGSVPGNTSQTPKAQENMR